MMALRSVVLISGTILSSMLAASPAMGAHCCHKLAGANIYQPAMSTQSVNASREQGVIVYRPAAVIDVARAQNIAARNAKLAQEARIAAARAKQAAAAQAQTDARLAAIEAKQNRILAQTRRPQQKKRNIFYGNPRFFGRNGFVGNSNFAGAFAPSKSNLLR